MFKESLEDGIVIVTLSHGKTNSITRETMEKMAVVLEKVNTDDAIKGLILTGEGKFFSSGFHLPTFINFKDHAAAVEFFEFEEEFLLNFFTCKKPVVCAMNGHTAAMGMILAMASDYRLVTNHPKVKLGMSEIKLGLALTVAELEVMRFGLDTDKKFRDVMYFGNMINPEKALAQGLVDEVLEADQLIPRAKDVIRTWIDNPGRAFITMKDTLKYDAAQRIRTKLAELDWRGGLHGFFDPNVKATLEFVQATMEG
ncbi:enoyl-CoA hydratase/isomerase family protein [Desulfobotulus sp.]|jgi:enoyl-CoA hydratase/carnithine racemase|uniref:enoyl-CoA hydratase/isomerase family protein n=1 Tax=Desulfobotulus sp. TaxID=1940337 RepID=UPI002A36504B|nr:enoyl-CoA hydratase/isomerase family protein [Desulfobotulus sp.]MDY0163255.1 enoyl-CoA hydratase/isomerase family protein [Desulfobotulus sp.]